MGWLRGRHQADYSLAVKNGTFAGLTTVPAKPGDIIILWGTGFGPTSPFAPLGIEVPPSPTYYTVSAVTATVVADSDQDFFFDSGNRRGLVSR
jgi:uncharacterized protein (TIGR03437 family)